MTTFGGRNSGGTLPKKMDTAVCQAQQQIPQQDGSSSSSGLVYYQQRSYHRRAYYMDQDKWGHDERDVRQEAAAYARAAPRAVTR